MDPVTIGAGVLALCGLYLQNKGIKESKIQSEKSLRQARQSNELAQKGLILGVVSVFVTAFLFWPRQEISETKYDVVNYYNDGTLKFVGNGAVENKQGQWKWFSTDGIVLKLETYNDNILNGVFKKYYDNGNMKIAGSYLNGTKNLKNWQCFHKNGSKQKCN